MLAHFLGFSSFLSFAGGALVSPEEALTGLTTLILVLASSHTKPSSLFAAATPKNTRPAKKKAALVTPGSLQAPCL